MGHRRSSLVQLERTFARELAAAKRFTDRIEADEKRWIASGKDPEREFARKYYRR